MQEAVSVHPSESSKSKASKLHIPFAAWSSLIFRLHHHLIKASDQLRIPQYNGNRTGTPVYHLIAILAFVPTDTETHPRQQSSRSRPHALPYILSLARLPRSSPFTLPTLHIAPPRSRPPP